MIQIYCISQVPNNARQYHAKTKNKLRKNIKRYSKLVILQPVYNKVRKVI